MKLVVFFIICVTLAYADIDCDCDPNGTLNFQCDRKTGACICRPGIGGYRCDKCARGYIGEAPICHPCNECFHNWDRIIHEHENKTLIQIERAKTIKEEGTQGDYTKEFDEMQSKLNEIETLLLSTNVTGLKSIDATSGTLQDRIKDLKEGQLKELTNNLASVDINNKQGERKLDELEKDLQRLVNKTKELQENATHLREANVQGALTLIEQAKEKANRAVQKAEMSAQINIDYAARQCKAIDHLINSTRDDLHKNHEAQEATLKEIRANVKNLTSIMPDVNNLVCYRYGDPCDPICGGAGCGVCGGTVSCDNGAKQLAEMALQIANNTEDILKKKEEQANDFIRNVNTVNTTLSKQNAEAAFKAANEAWTKANETFSKLAFTKKDLQDFFNGNKTSPEDMDRRIQEVLDKKINPDKSEMQMLAEEIKKANETRRSIEEIIADTEDDLKQAQELKYKADSVKQRIVGIKNITETLGNSNTTQTGADAKIEELIKIVEENYEEAKRDINITDMKIKKLQDTITHLQVNASNIEHIASTFTATSQSIDKDAEELFTQLGTLKIDHNNTEATLKESWRKVEDSEHKASKLAERVHRMCNEVMNQIPNEALDQLESEIDALNRRIEEYNDQIQKKLEGYKTCN